MNDEEFKLRLGVRRFGSKAFDEIAATYKFSEIATPALLQERWACWASEVAQTSAEATKQPAKAGEERLVFCIGDVLRESSFTENGDEEDEENNEEQSRYARRLDSLLGIWIANFYATQTKTLGHLIVRACLPIHLRQTEQAGRQILLKLATLPDLFPSPPSSSKRSMKTIQLVWETFTKEVAIAGDEEDKMDCTLPLLQVLCTSPRAVKLALTGTDLGPFLLHCRNQFTHRGQAFDGNARLLCECLLKLT
ncbi:hypothetical protein BASA81_003539 [Batrachochytrium salamandrivorans]|nr:hypothetical protein BASA81_003539 [Batrachochytrium salamandrivorans]